MLPQGGSLDMMIMPEAANMPPTPWQTEILGAGDRGGGGTAHLAHAPGEVSGTHAHMSIIPRWQDNEG